MELVIAICVLLVFSCLMTNVVSNCLLHNKLYLIIILFCDDNLKKVFNKIANPHQIRAISLLRSPDLGKNSNSLAEIPTDAATNAAETENLKKNSSSLAEGLRNSTGSAAEDVRKNSHSLCSVVDTITSNNLNKNSSCLAGILHPAGEIIVVWKLLKCSYAFLRKFSLNLKLAQVTYVKQSKN
uniref:Uncharacterized protein n=1 Tax=Glossina palpalis gambiensis TaxID=67801 RepID=A0A1B0C7F3_9MUSC